MPNSKKNRNHQILYIFLAVITVVSLFSISYLLNDTSELKGSINKTTVSQSKSAANQAKSNFSKSAVTNEQILEAINRLQSQLEEHNEHISNILFEDRGSAEEHNEHMNNIHQ